jgi:hypothetical protein
MRRKNYGIGRGDVKGKTRAGERSQSGFKLSGSYQAHNLLQVVIARAHLPKTRHHF